MGFIYIYSRSYIGAAGETRAVRFTSRTEERERERGKSTTRRRHHRPPAASPPRWRCASSPGSTSASPLLSPAGTPRATRGRPPPTRRSSAAGSPPRRRPPRPPPRRRRVGRRARGGRWGTCSAWRSLWSALPTRRSRYTVASARLPATAAPSNDARCEFPSSSIWFISLLGMVMRVAYWAYVNNVCCIRSNLIARLHQW